MIRNIRALGLALAAVFALSAMAASAAQAVEAEFEAAETASVSGLGGLQVFQTSFGKLTCASATGSGSQAEGATPEMLGENIAYNNCHATILKIPTVVDMNGCDYLFTAGVSTATGTSEGSVHIEGCEPSEPGITITVGNEGGACTIHVGEQTIEGVTYHTIETEDGTEHVEVRTNEVLVQQNSTGGSACSSGASTSKYTGNFVASGENAKGDPVNLTVIP